MNLFRKTSIASDPVVRRSSLTISEALEAARQAGLQTPESFTLAHAHRRVSASQSVVGLDELNH